MNMVIHGDLEGPGVKGAMVYFDVLFPNTRTGPKKTASNRMADVLRNTYLRLISSCRLNQLHWTTNFKNIFVSVMNMLLIYLFASMKLEKGHRKLLGSIFKIMLPL